MSTPPLLRHGQHVKPHYEPVLGENEGWAGKSTDESFESSEPSMI